MTSSRIRASNLPVPDHANFEPEIAQRATQIAFHVEQFPLQKLAARQQHSLLLSPLRLHMHWLEQAYPHHLGNPRASFRSLLLICCAFRSAIMCRVSTQTAGSPAAVRPLTNHCDRGPASIPIRP